MQSVLHRLFSRAAWRKRLADVDLLWIGAIFWGVSLLRVIGAALRHEAFQAEATLALAVVVGFPFVALGFHRARRARKARRS